MPSDSIKDQVAVVGIGNTEYGRDLGRHSLDLITEAMQKALDDCGLRKEDIDGLCTNFGGGPYALDTDAVAQALGLNLRWYGQTWTHGRFNGTVVQWASFVLHHGLASYVACFFGNGRGRHQAGGGGVEEARETGGGHAQSPPYGMTSPAAGAALAFRKYMLRYNVRRELLGWVPVTFRKHASMNPFAIMRKPITMEDYLNARVICDPLRLLDYCLINDGGCCVIMTTADRARHLKKPPVYVMGFQGLHGGRNEFIFGP
ncbi:MAG: hypothetical protein HYU29_01515, partial [Chloroflexi bacterium]|nr:hypothetical protein [Chloroflexota bacterium]